MIGGFNFKDGVEGYKSGDIFIKTDNGTPPTYGSSAVGTGNNNIVSNSFGYNYVVKLNLGAASTYDAYSIDGNAQVKTVSYQQNEGANPGSTCPVGPRYFQARRRFPVT